MVLCAERQFENMKAICEFVSRWARFELHGGLFELYAVINWCTIVTFYIGFILLSFSHLDIFYIFDRQMLLMHLQRLRFWFEFGFWYDTMCRHIICGHITETTRKKIKSIQNCGECSIKSTLNTHGLLCAQISISKQHYLSISNGKFA